MIKFSLVRDKVLPHQPTRAEIIKWIRASLQQKYQMVMLTISIVDKETSRGLNFEYRGKNKPTNVISLEYADSRAEFNFLSGELMLCDEIIVEEANSQDKPILSHYAHMLVHGILHLQGYDHIEDKEAEEMEVLEAAILSKFGFSNPYLEERFNEKVISD